MKSVESARPERSLEVVRRSIGDCQYSLRPAAKTEKSTTAAASGTSTCSRGRVSAIHATVATTTASTAEFDPDRSSPATISRSAPIAARRAAPVRAVVMSIAAGTVATPHRPPRSFTSYAIPLTLPKWTLAPGITSPQIVCTTAAVPPSAAESTQHQIAARRRRLVFRRMLPSQNQTTVR